MRLSYSLPPWSRWISPTRLYVAEVLEPLLPDRDTVDKLAIAIHELLENCIKYSNGDTVRFEFELNRQGDEAVANIQTTNSALKAHTLQLCQKIDALNAAKDPIAHYDAVIRASVTNEGSSLGLARIRAESGIKLSYRVQNDVVVVFGEMSLSLKGNG